MVNLITFPSIKSSYPKNFPLFVDPSEVESFSFSSFEERIIETQEAYLPYYTVAVVESGKGRFYHVYDAAYFSKYYFDQRKSADPLTGLSVGRVHYFALKCFKINKKEICEPVNLKTDPLQFLSFGTFLHSWQDKKTTSKKVKELLLDSCDSFIFNSGEKEDQKQMREYHLIIAHLIKEKWLLLPLTSQEREQEVIEWLWCSSRGDPEARYELADKILAHSELFDEPEELVDRLLSNPYETPYSQNLSNSSRRK